MRFRTSNGVWRPGLDYAERFLVYFLFLFFFFFSLFSTLFVSAI